MRIALSGELTRIKGLLPEMSMWDINRKLNCTLLLILLITQEADRDSQKGNNEYPDHTVISLAVPVRAKTFFIHRLE
jgi:hypothetical protein